MRSFVRAALIAGLGIWIIRLRRELRDARLRGDMYRDAAGRMERRLGPPGGQER